MQIAGKGGRCSQATEEQLNLPSCHLGLVCLRGLSRRCGESFWASALGRRRQTRQRPGWEHRDSLPPRLTPAPAWQPGSGSWELLGKQSTSAEHLPRNWSSPTSFGFHNSQEEELIIFAKRGLRTQIHTVGGWPEQGLKLWWI